MIGFSDWIVRSLDTVTNRNQKCYRAPTISTPKQLDLSCPASFDSMEKNAAIA